MGEHGGMSGPLGESHGICDNDCVPDRQETPMSSASASASASASVPALLTAEEYALRPDPGYPEELVRGRVVPMQQPKPRHGHLCNKAGRFLGNFCEEHHL